MKEILELEVGLARLTLELRGRQERGEPAADLEPAAGELQRLADRLGVPEFSAVVRIRRAEVLVSAGRDDEAEAALREARAVLGGLRKHDLEVGALGHLARIRARRGEWAAVDALCAEGIALVEEVRGRVNATYMKSAYLQSRLVLYALGVRAAFELGDHDAMLRRAELSKARGLVRPGGAPGEGSTSAEMERLQRRFEELCARVDRQGAEAPESLLAERRAVWDLISVQRAREHGRGEPPPFSTAAVQRLLRDDEAVVYFYFVDPHTLLRVLLRRRQLQAELLPLSEERRAQLEADAEYLLPHASEGVGAAAPARPEFPARVDQICRRWYELLPDEAARQDVRRLVISPHGVLHALPFHAMPRMRQPLLRSHAVSYVPSLGSLLLPMGTPPEPGVFLLGVRDYAHPGEAVTPLPFAEEEVQRIGEAYAGAGVPTRMLRGAAATEGAVQRLARGGELARFSCLHLATHGVNVPGDTPMESFLYAQDSRIDGMEIAGWRLGAGLVVLSACSAGQRPFRGRGMRSIPGDELFGLQAAFFAAGCRSLVAALWPVPDRVALPLMTALHRHLAAGAPPDLALQRATLEHLETATASDRRIAAWGCFFFVTLGPLPEHPPSLPGEP